MQLIHVKHCTKTELVWNHDVWDEELFGPKPSDFIDWGYTDDDVVAGKKEDKDAGDEPLGRYQDMSAYQPAMADFHYGLV